MIPSVSRIQLASISPIIRFAVGVRNCDDMNFVAAFAIDDFVRESSEQKLSARDWPLPQSAYFRTSSDEVDRVSNGVKEFGPQAWSLMFVPAHGLS